MIKPLNTINKEYDLSMVHKKTHHKSRPSTSTATSQKQKYGQAFKFNQLNRNASRPKKAINQQWNKAYA